MPKKEEGKSTFLSDAFTRIESMLSLKGGLPEGARLPAERDLATDLGVSRRALRGILAHFEAEGAIIRRQGAGTVVVRHLTSCDEEVIRLKKLTSPRELMEARQILEPAIASLAAINATNQDLEDMRVYLERGATAHDAEGWERWDGALHRAICHATHNVLIQTLFETLNAARFHAEWGQLRKMTLNVELKEIYTAQHRRLLQALEHRDAEDAANAMRQHLQSVKQTLFNL
jgi:DNA-binding FadR family transcriptional regulator